MSKRWLTEFRVIMPEGSDKPVCNWGGPDILAETYEEAEKIRKHWYPYCTIKGEHIATYEAREPIVEGNCPDFYEEYEKGLKDISTHYGFEPCKN